MIMPVVFCDLRNHIKEIVTQVFEGETTNNKAAELIEARSRLSLRQNILADCLQLRAKADCQNMLQQCCSVPCNPGSANLQDAVEHHDAYQWAWHLPGHRFLWWAVLISDTDGSISEGIRGAF